MRLALAAAAVCACVSGNPRTGAASSFVPRYGASVAIVRQAPGLVLSDAPGAAVAASVPSIALRNSAAPGQTMPAIGLGTGSYSDDPKVGYGGYPGA